MSSCPHTQIVVYRSAVDGPQIVTFPCKLCLAEAEGQYLQRLVIQLCERIARRENAYVEAWLQQHVSLRNVHTYTLVSFPYRPGYYELRHGSEAKVVSTLQVPPLPEPE